MTEWATLRKIDRRSTIYSIHQMVSVTRYHFLDVSQQQGSSTPCRFIGLSRNLSEILCFPGSWRLNIPGQALISLRTAQKPYFKNLGLRNGCNSARRVLQASSPTPGSSEGTLGAHAVAAGSDMDAKSLNFILHLTRLRTKHNRSLRLPRHQKACPSTVGGSQHCTQQWQ
jgi:hypothetical protein